MYYIMKGFPGGSVVKNLPANAGDIRDAVSIPQLGRYPGGGHPTHFSFPGEFHGQRSLAGYCPLGFKEPGPNE